MSQPEQQPVSIGTPDLTVEPVLMQLWLEEDQRVDMKLSVAAVVQVLTMRDGAVLYGENASTGNLEIIAPGRIIRATILKSGDSAV